MVRGARGSAQLILKAGDLESPLERKEDRVRLVEDKIKCSLSRGDAA